MSRLVVVALAGKSAGAFFRTKVMIGVMVTTMFASLSPIGLSISFAAPPASAISEELRFHGISRQLLDDSCGLAALSTLMEFWFGNTTTATEKHLLETWKKLPIAVGRSDKFKEGFTRGDLLEIARASGYKAEWIPVHASAINKIPKPVVTLIHRPGSASGHYIVLKGADSEFAYSADPILGHVREGTDAFVRQWANENGRALVLVIDREDRGALRKSLLTLNQADGAVESHLSVREAILRRQSMLAAGQTILRVDLAHIRFRHWENVLPGGTTVGQDRSVTAGAISIERGISDNVTVSASVPGYRVTESVNIAGDTISNRQNKSGDLLFGVDKRIVPELDSGTPAIIAGARVYVPTGGTSYGIGGGIRAEKSFENFTLRGNLDYVRRLRLNEDDPNEVNLKHNVSAGVGISLLLNNTSAIDVGVSSRRDRGSQNSAQGNAISIGMRTRIADRLYVQPSILFGFGSTASTGASIGLIFTP